MRKRIGSLLLSLALCLTLLPTAALAEGAQPEEPLPQEQTESAEPTPEEPEDSEQPEETPEEPEVPEGPEEPEQPETPEEPEENEEQPQQDEDVIAVQEMIDALPDASELDEMDEEAQESACLAASEAYDAYYALTEEQQSAITGAGNLLAILEWATQQVELLADDVDPAKHTGDHTGWTKIATGYGNKVQKNNTEWTTTSSTSGEEYYVLEAGNYYLGNDISLGNSIRIQENATVTLCLNGNTITGGNGKDAIIVAAGATLNLTDCKDTGKITHKAGETGRGVYVNDGTFNMYDCTFNMYGGSITGNSTTATTDYGNNSKGGGVYVNDSRAAFNMCGGSITGNQANGDGGGVYVENGKFKMTGGTIGGTTAGDANTAKYGGGVYVVDSNPGTVPTCTFDMTGGSITGNTATQNGGGVFVGKKGTFTMTGGTIGGTDSNAANTATKYGGGVAVVGTFNMSGSAAITGNKINENSGIGGGGVYVGYEEVSGYTVYGQFTMSDNARITGNTATPTGSGGGVYMTSDTKSTETYTCTFTMTGGTIDANTAHNGGGVCVRSGKFTMSGGSIAGNTAEYGGGVAMTKVSDLPAPTFTMSGSASITGNQATSYGGGGVYVGCKGSQFTMEGGTIGGENEGDGNSAASFGGGVCVEYGTFKMTAGKIAGNTAPHGGGVAVYSAGTFNMSGGSITGNSSTKQGGGVYVSGTFNMSGGSITNNIGDTGVDNTSNSGRGGGGVLVAEGGTFNMTDGSITGNEAKGPYSNDTNYRGTGGGVLVEGTFTMSGGSITGNKADSSNTGGGGVCVHSGKFTMSGGSIAGNTAEDGGGVYVTGSCTFTMSGGTVGGRKGNTATNGGGVFVYYGGTFNMSGDAAIIGNTATFNSVGASGGGGGVYVRGGGKLTMSDNAAITGNHAKVNGGGVYMDGSITVSGAVDITGNSKGGTKGEGNVYTGSTTDDLYLYFRNTVAIGEGGLTDNAKIGVGLYKNSSDAFTSNWNTYMSGKTPSDYFTSDVDGYAPVLNDDGEVYLVEHTHNWTYVLKDGTTDTITATCKNCDANGGKAYTGSITIHAPAVSELTYDGNAKAAAVTKDQWSGNAAISYQLKKSGDTWEGISGTPTNAGTYKASITLGGVTASVEYTIQKADPQASDFNVTLPADLTYDGSAKEATAALKSPKTGAGDISVKYYKDGTKVTEAKDAGEYTVKISVAEGANYSATTTDLTAEGWEFTIGKADQTITVPSNKTIVKNGIAVDISAGVSVKGAENGTVPGALSYALDGSYTGVTLENGQLTVEPTSSETTITIKVTAAATDNYNEKTETFTVTVKDKATANVEITGLPETVTYGQEFTLTPTAKDGETVLSDGKWAWEYDEEHFKQLESNANTGVLKLQAIKAGTPGKTDITMTYTSDTYTGSASVNVSSIAKKTLTQNDLDGIPNKLTKVYDGTDKHTDSIRLADNEEVNNIRLYITVDKSKITYNDANAGKATSATLSLEGINLGPNYQFAEGFTSITVDAEITQRPLTIIGAAAENRKFEFENKVVDVSSVTFDDLPDGVTLTKGTDYTVTGKMNDHDAGTKDVDVTVTMLNGNYSLAQNTTTTTVTISKATYTGGSVAVSWRYNETGTKTVSLNESLPHGVGSAHYSIQNIQNENGVLTGSPTLAYGEYNSTVTYTLTGQNQYTANQTAQFSVKVDSPNYEPFTIHCDITLLDKGDATVSINDMPNTVTYGDTFTLTAEARDADENTLLTGGAWTWTSSDASVLAIEGSGSSVTVKALKAGEATISVSYESETMKGTASIADVTVGKKSITAPAADQTVYTYNSKEQTYQLAENEAYTVSDNVQIDANETGYTVTVSLKDTANTQWADGTTADKTYRFVIEKATVTVTAKNQSAYVGATAPVLGADSYTVSGLFGADELTTEPTLKYVDADGNETTPDMTKTGDTIIRASGAAAGDNYTIDYVDGKLTVSSRPSSGGGSSSPSYTVTVPGKTANGSVTVSPKSARKGDTVTVTATPDKGYTLETITVLDKDGKELKLTEKNGKYTFTMPASAVTVKAAFMDDNAMLNFFTDVTVSDYCYDAVLWAAKGGITSGTDAVHFSPSAPCTRAQIVTFLWRAAGSPVVNYAMDLDDVPGDAYYAEAVRWALSLRITGGTGNGKFDPNAICTRAQAVTFLYRALGEPDGSKAAFSDVPADSYYADAVAWAAKNGVTLGTTADTFSPAQGCTRAQIVTFLYRAYQGK